MITSYSSQWCWLSPVTQLLVVILGSIFEVQGIPRPCFEIHLVSYSFVDVRKGVLLHQCPRDQLFTTSNHRMDSSLVSTTVTFRHWSGPGLHSTSKGRPNRTPTGTFSYDNVEVRKSVLMTTECGENYIRTKPGGVKEPTLSHHTFFTTKLIPKLDNLIDDKNMGKMRSMTQDLVTAVFSDGWTAGNHHPIVNIIMGVRFLFIMNQESEI